MLKIANPTLELTFDRTTGELQINDRRDPKARLSSRVVGREWACRRRPNGLSLDGSHGHSEMVVLGATPATFAKPLCTWDQPHPQTTSYHNKHMTFPAVEGRMQGLIVTASPSATV